MGNTKRKRGTNTPKRNSFEKFLLELSMEFIVLRASYDLIKIKKNNQFNSRSICYKYINKITFCQVF